MLTKEKLNDIESLMFNKARDIDVALFNTYVSSMPKEFVFSALMMYQNKDGGLGHALDCDNLNPNSTVYQSYYGLKLLSQAGYKSYKDDEDFEVFLNKIFNYLYNRKTNWSLYDEQNLKFACAERFRHESDSLFPGNAIVGYTLYFLDENKPYYKKALDKLSFYLDKLKTKGELSSDELLGYKILFDSLKLKNIEIDVDALALYEKELLKLKNNTSLSELNYDVLPELSDDISIVEESLQMMISSIKHHGMWESTTEWGNDYPEGESAKLKWLGQKTAQNIYLLKKFKKIEE